MSRHGNLRINIFLICVILLSGLVLYRLFVLSIVRHSSYLRTAQAQNESISNILARGSIYLSDKDSNLTLAANNKKFPLAYVIPSGIEDSKRDEISTKLADILKVEASVIKEKIDSKSNSMKVIARRLEIDQVEAIKGLKLKAIGISYEMDRLYPGNDLAANIIGFLGYDTEGKRAGQYGVEGYYNQELFGDVDSKFNRPSDIILTIDKNIQTQSRGLYRAEKGGNEWRNISKEQGEKQILSDEEIFPQKQGGGNSD